MVKYGNARVALIGFPSVGKSTLLTELTGTESEAAAYEFTTLTCIPGVIHYNGAKIQLLDLPGIIEGASQGKGRGRQVIAVSKTADLIMMVLDGAKDNVLRHREILTAELESVGLRLNQRPPDVYFRKKKTGGLTFTATCKLTHIDEKMAYQILHEYKIHNCELLIREDITVDQLIDVLEAPSRKYVRCLYVFNKVDMLSIEELDALARQPNTAVISCRMKLGLDQLLARMWEEMALVRVYTKPPKGRPDFEEPVILSSERGGMTVGNFCKQVHASLLRTLAYANVWGASAKHTPQRVGAQHVLEDEDVVSLVKSKDADKEELRGRFSTTKRNDPDRIADRVRKEKLKT